MVAYVALGALPIQLGLGDVAEIGEDGAGLLGESRAAAGVEDFTANRERASWPAVATRATSRFIGLNAPDSRTGISAQLLLTSAARGV
jgi:hypothetical protein